VRRSESVNVVARRCVLRSTDRCSTPDSVIQTRALTASTAASTTLASPCGPPPAGQRYSAVPKILSAWLRVAVYEGEVQMYGFTYYSFRFLRYRYTGTLSKQTVKDRYG